MDGDLPTVRLSSSFDTRYSSELAFQCLQSEVNQHLVAEVMPILLKSGEKGGTPSGSSWNSFDPPVSLANQSIEPRNLHVSSILDHPVLNLICHARTAGGS
ncbi:hypothetical protein F2Q69_00023573 [Brassica cretica]|uniref:Uncharacterized protein n=1 Tax=Brassica cretica TaxID=69181 RepID=A0A8S9QN75_BRACR|nr:hypothetical protein F2Q69_00023573 [Brassica cretica]